MLKQIILPVVLLIFTQQNFYGMEVENAEAVGEKESDLQKNKWWEFLENDMRESTCLSYHIRALFNNFFRKWCGAYKRVELSYGEFFYGTVTGIGWYPQFLNFNNHFRMGFLEISYNIITFIYHIAIDFFTKGKIIFFFDSFIHGFSLNIINFKIYKGLIKLNFINPYICFIGYCNAAAQDRGFNTAEWEKMENSSISWPEILFFGKELKSISEIKDLLVDPNQDKKEVIIKVLFLVLNCVLLPEIYIDFSCFIK